ncbi:hypothetical protein JYU34_001608 [Plutella xylostella]|uniref:Uncharacterized protein n=1 Tax=Plutella xylostella TaxID=51655 RepID=A0ABQ7R4E7_PLUXY|nr:hypothetical protein JYU34_001608 [Plutella xylostella]
MFVAKLASAFESIQQEANTTARPNFYSNCQNWRLLRSVYACVEEQDGDISVLVAQNELCGSRLTFGARFVAGKMCVSVCRQRSAAARRPAQPARAHTAS